MSTPDFSKIWGSNVSPENRYKFTDSAYLEGWSYIGSVPPAREAFDTLFRDIDTKMSYLNDELKNKSDSVKEHDANAAAHNAMATTVDDTLVPTSDTNTIRNLVSNLANRIKAATGAGGWKEAPAATLASLSTMIANLATGADVAWDGKKFTNHRLGITGLMDQNGYICFGPNCGGLIIQWGMCSGTSDKQDQWFQPFPLSVSECFSVSLNRHGGDSVAYIVRIVSVVNNGFYWTDASYVTGTHGSGDPNLWIAICR